MEVRIGVVHTPKELAIEVAQSEAEVMALVDKAMADDDSVLWLTDVKGRRIGIPAGKLAYVEIDADAATKRVGFGP